MRIKRKVRVKHSRWPWWRTVDDLEILSNFYEVSPRTLQRWAQNGCVLNDIRSVMEFLETANRKSRGPERHRCMERSTLARNVYTFLANRASKRH
jgi:hypothetical protein